MREGEGPHAMRFRTVNGWGPVQSGGVRGHCIDLPKWSLTAWGLPPPPAPSVNRQTPIKHYLAHPS